MKRPICLALLFTISAAPAFAQESPRTLATVEVRSALYVVDCHHRVPPSQREVGDWSGLHNLGQAYAARERLISEIDRACHRPGIARVQLVGDDELSGETQHVVVARPRGR